MTSSTESTRIWLHWRPGQYLRSSSTLLCWLAARALTQVALILALTHIFPPRDYGAFIATVAVATLFTPLAGLGIYSVLVRDGARAPHRLPQLLSDALNLWALSTLVFGATGVMAAILILPNTIGKSTMALLVIGEIASASIIEILARAEQAQHRTNDYGAINAGLVIVRLLALGICVAAGTKTLQQWIFAYAMSSLAYGAAILWRAKLRYSLTISRRFHWLLVWEGWPFLLATLSLRLQAEANKPIIAAIGLAPVATFNVAQRALDVAGLPLNSLQETLTPRLFASRHPLKDAGLPMALILSLGCAEAFAIWVAAPFVPRFLGDGYSEVVWLIRAMAFLPALQVLRTILGSIVVASNRPSALSRSYIITMTVSVGLYLILVKAYQLQGAVAASYLTELLTAITLAASIVGTAHNTPSKSHEK